MAIRREALLAADGGRMELAADLTRAAMSENGYARGILADLTHGLWALQKSFIGSREQIAALDDTPESVGQWRKMFPEPDAIRLEAWGITLGVGVGQMRRRYSDTWRPTVDYPISPDEAADGSWKVKPVRPVGALDYRVLRTWDPKYLRHQWWDETWWLMTADGEIRLTPNEGEWLLYTPYGETKPWEYGAWRALTLAFVLARDATFDRARHAEVLAPVRVGKVPQGTTERQRQKFLRLIREMQRMQVFVLPPGLEYSIVESSGRVTQLYKEILEWSERDFAMITGAITTATGSPGFSKGDVQERFTRSILGAFASSLSTCLHDGGLVPWAETNYGTAEAARAEFNTEAPEDKLKRAQTLDTAGKALVSIIEGLAKAGKKMTAASAEKYAQSLGFDVEDLTNPVSKIQLGVDAVMAVVRGGLALDSLGAPRFGDERDDMTLAELANVAKNPAPPSPGTGADSTTPDDATAAPASDEPLSDEDAEALALTMTEHGVDRCWHGTVNSCRFCRVEQRREIVRSAKGKPPTWRIAWRAIKRASSNGAATTPLLSMGGDA